MADPNVTKLVTWLRQQTKIARPLGDVTRFELRHLTVGSKRGSEVQAFDPPRSDATEEWYETAAQSILTAAELDCINLTGASQSYVLVAFRGEKGAEKIDARYPLPRVYKPQDDAEPESFESEPPTKTGLTSQLMRHNVELARINAQMLSTITNAQSRTIMRQADQIEDFQKQRAELFEMLEDVEGRRQERAIEVMKVESRQKMIEQALPTAKLLGGVIADKITGRQISGADPRAHIAKELYASLTEEQVEQLGRIMRPDQLTAIGALMLPGENGEH